MTDGGLGQEVVHEDEGDEHQRLGGDRDRRVGPGVLSVRLAAQDDHVEVLQQGQEQEAAERGEHVGEQDLAAVHGRGDDRLGRLGHHLLLEHQARLARRSTARPARRIGRTARVDERARAAPSSRSPAAAIAHHGACGGEAGVGGGDQLGEEEAEGGAFDPELGGHAHGERTAHDRFDDEVDREVLVVAAHLRAGRGRWTARIQTPPAVRISVTPLGRGKRQRVRHGHPDEEHHHGEDQRPSPRRCGGRAPPRAGPGPRAPPPATPTPAAPRRRAGPCRACDTTRNSPSRTMSVP